MNEQSSGLGREVYEKVTEYIDSIAAGLGVAASHVYEIMARQMIVEGIVYTAVWLTIMIGLTIVVVKMAKLTVRKIRDIEKADAEYPVFLGWFFGGFIYLIVIIIGLTSLPTRIMKILNPEYYVIREIISIFGGGA